MAKNSTGWWFRNVDGSYPVNKWQNVGGEWFWFGGNGYCYINRWLKDADK